MYQYDNPADLDSFPTRRSSDLGPLTGTIGSEIDRLRSLAPRVPGSLTLLDLPQARASTLDDAPFEELAAAGDEAYALRSRGDGSDRGDDSAGDASSARLEVIGGGARGLLYGFYAVVLGLAPAPSGAWTIHSPGNSIRMLDHWDNMIVHPAMGQVERGYAGGSLFYEDGELREDLTRVEHYSRLLASVGINRVAINNVNVHAREATL